MVLIDIYLRTVEGRIVLLKNVGTTGLTLGELTKQANEHFDPTLNFAKVRFLYRGKKLDEQGFTDIVNNTEKMLFLDIVEVGSKVASKKRVRVYLLKSGVASAGDLYPTGHEDSPFMRVGVIEYGKLYPNPLSLSYFKLYMQLIEADIDNLLRAANSEKIINKHVDFEFDEIMREKDVQGGSRKTMRRGVSGGRKSRRMK
jgi:hypothetical protein